MQPSPIWGKWPTSTQPTLRRQFGDAFCFFERRRAAAEAGIGTLAPAPQRRPPKEAMSNDQLAPRRTRGNSGAWEHNQRKRGLSRRFKVADIALRGI